MSAFDEYMTAKKAGTHNDDELDALRAQAFAEIQTEQDAITAWEIRNGHLPGRVEESALDRYVAARSEGTCSPEELEALYEAASIEVEADKHAFALWDARQELLLDLTWK